MAGKGVTIGIMLKYIFYVSVVAVPKAIPIAILLSSIMTFGQLSENYEFAAIKSAGISLIKLLSPLIIIVIVLSIVNLFFLNNAYPWAMYKHKNLYANIKKKQPALALVEGSFNNDLDGFTIKFDKKHGEDQNLLDNVIIYQTKNNGNISTITAKKGTIFSSDGSKYMSLKLEDGYYYEEHSHRGSKQEIREKDPFSTTHFDTYTVNIDVSKFTLNDLEVNQYDDDREMLSLKQLDYSSDSLKTQWDDYINHRSQNFFFSMNGNKLIEDPLSKTANIKGEILDNFNLKEQAEVLSIAENNITNFIYDFDYFSIDYKHKRKGLNLIDTEYHHRIAIAFSALLLFIIGAPIGSLIRRGGFGAPMVIAIVIYMVYHFLSSFAVNMADESSITDFWGGWLSTLLLIPLSIYLIISAQMDRAKINFKGIIDKFYILFIKKNKTNSIEDDKDTDLLDE